MYAQVRPNTACTTAYIMQRMRSKEALKCRWISYSLHYDYTEHRENQQKQGKYWNNELRVAKIIMIKIDKNIYSSCSRNRKREKREREKRETVSKTKTMLTHGWNGKSGVMDSWESRRNQQIVDGQVC